MSLLGRLIDDEDRKAARELAARAAPRLGRVVGISLSMLALAAAAGLAVRLFQFAAGL